MSSYFNDPNLVRSIFYNSCRDLSDRSMYARAEEYRVMYENGILSAQEYGEALARLNPSVEILEPEPAPDFIGPRGTYKVEKLGWDWKNDPDIEKGYYEPADYADANLVGSKTSLEEDGHLPIIDLDLPAHLEPSTKPDHYHLYINKVVPWDKYVNLLKAMYEAGLVNEGFYEMSVRRGQSYVRRPGVFKKTGEGDS